ncbi:hypothetical protein [Ferrimonas sp. YFM]|uniref:hypothetical protein n=1 Tax=Ferrimonas sp. YFM TaxID=3028878 RepID=UPI002573996C|nr:hypothetical protein [Ferrimonas sp. YFM]BDY03417.1 hypothetical protein F0521_04580 [Ferrimonas sp. YFM]
MNQTLTDLIGEQGELTHLLNLTNHQHLSKLTSMANHLLEQGLDLYQLKELEQELILHQALAAKMAVKLAISKLYLRECRPNTLISVVFAMYKEHNRMLSPQEHPHGEAFIQRKFEQLEWLCQDNPKVRWRLILLDDGCPENSGGRALEQLDALPGTPPIEVVFLKEAIREKRGPAAGLDSTNDSQKGGSIAHGLWHAAQYPHQGEHFVAYTDADLSTHLGQLGLLVENLQRHDNLIACGSRREPTSVVVKQGMRNNRGKLFIYLWKRLLPQLNSIIDTQCGFKMLRASCIDGLTRHMLEKRFAFDIELLLRMSLDQPERIGKVAVGWIDSDALSTTTELSPYLSMLKSVVAMYRHYLPAHPVSDQFAALIDKMDEDQWERLVAALGPIFDGVEISRLCSTELMSAVQLAQKAGTAA